MVLIKDILPVLIDTILSYHGINFLSNHIHENIDLYIIMSLISLGCASLHTFDESKLDQGS